jgi:cytochrome c-type biogenesis protein CcmH/NrfG
MKNAKNVKAWYRSARACFALDKVEEAADSLARGLEIEPDNKTLLSLKAKVEERSQVLREKLQKKEEQARTKKAEEMTLQYALKV